MKAPLVVDIAVELQPGEPPFHLRTVRELKEILGFCAEIIIIIIITAR